jgi:hypothetical protein
LPDGVGALWIAENGCADGGDPAKGLSGPSWIDGVSEGYEYNHSTFADLILSGLVGWTVAALPSRLAPPSYHPPLCVPLGFSMDGNQLPAGMARAPR